MWHCHHLLSLCFIPVCLCTLYACRAVLCICVALSQSASAGAGVARQHAGARPGEALLGRGRTQELVADWCKHRRTRVSHARVLYAYVVVYDNQLFDRSFHKIRAVTNCLFCLIVACPRIRTATSCGARSASASSVKTSSCWRAPSTVQPLPQAPATTAPARQQRPAQQLKMTQVAIMVFHCSSSTIICFLPTSCRRATAHALIVRRTTTRPCRHTTSKHRKSVDCAPPTSISRQPQ